MSPLCHLCPLTRANSAALRSGRASRHAPAVEHWAGFGAEAPFQRPLQDTRERLRLAANRRMWPTVADPEQSAKILESGRSVKHV